MKGQEGFIVKGKEKPSAISYLMARTDLPPNMNPTTPETSKNPWAVLIMSVRVWDHHRAKEPFIFTHSNLFHPQQVLFFSSFSSANNESLEVLNLSWNHLRMKGAVALSAGLRVRLRWVSSLRILGRGSREQGEAGDQFRNNA